MHVEILKDFTDLGGNLHVAGTLEHARTATAETWLDAKLAKKVVYTNAAERLAALEAAKPKVYAKATFAVCTGAISGRYYIGAKCSAPHCSSFVFDGAPTSALELLTFTHSCGSGYLGAEKIPAEVAAQYRKLYKSPTQYGNDEALALRLSAPQPSLPVDLYSSKEVNGVRQPPIVGAAQGHPVVAGSEAGLSPLLFLPATEEHVDKTIFGPQNGAALILSDEITHPVTVK